MPSRRRGALHVVRRRQADARRFARRLALRTGKPSSAQVRVLYGLLRSPRGDEHAWGGGLVDLLHLMSRYPPAMRDFNVFYVDSASLGTIPDVRKLVRIARRRSARIILNQDGVGSPGWAGFARNDPQVGPEAMRLASDLIHGADYVVFQSAFCKESADTFFGGREGPWEVLHNAVDVERFVPPPTPLEGPPVLLLGGNQVQPDRLATAVRTLRYVVDEEPETRLLVTGMVRFPENDLIRQLRLEAHIDFLGTYSLRDAPQIYRRAHLLLHTRVNDPCPNTVLEAMASGLPVVHANSGGVPELVAGVGGIGVPVERSWDRDIPPDPEALAGAVLRVLDRLSALGSAARRRAVKHHSLSGWLTRHTVLLEGLVLGS